MKKRYLVVTALLALSLAACSQEKAKNEDGTAKTEQTAKADGTVGSKSQGAAQKKQKWSIKVITTASKENTTKSS